MTEPHTQPRNPNPAPQLDWIARWQRVARRIRVPLGFLSAALYLFELWRRPPLPVAVAWSLALVLPGLWLRGYAAGYVKKNRELTQTGPYAYTRNPLYLGSMLIAAGFAVALLSWPVALVLAFGFAVIYIPVIASEERFLRATFPWDRRLLACQDRKDRHQQAYGLHGVAPSGTTTRVSATPSPGFNTPLQCFWQPSESHCHTRSGYRSNCSH